MIRLIPLAITILLIILANSAYCSTVEDVIQTLSSISEPSVTNWRYIAGDVPDAKMPDFDDSNWKTGSPEFIWGEEPIAWMRTAITIPEEIAGFQVKGARIILRVAVDDDGIIFVNGKEADTFNWDNGRAVLTDNAVPGDVISVAIKGINRIGPGRLMQAWLEVEPLTDIRMRIQAYLADIETAKTLAGNNSEIIEKSIATVDLTAIQTGDRQKLIDSLSQASDILTILAPDIKNNTCHLVGHAHIDMNWLWLWPETIEVCNNTFNTMCKLMQEYPDFLYSQSQPSTYVIVEETNPDLFKSIGQRIKEGRWEVTGGTWVEGDMNMASGESIVRQILYAKQYFKEKFNVEPRICWSPDTFGHAWTIPQILAKSNIDFYYFMRAGKGEPIFWWEAPDGSRVLAFNDDNYNGDIKDSIGQEMAEMHKQYGVKDHLVVYGVGDHGGGPTRGQLRKARELQHRTLFPTVKFSTAEQFFKAILPKSDTFPVIRDELNFVFRGCYTTHSDIKKMNRTLENLLPSAEAFSAITSTLYDSIDYPIDDFKTAWQSTCFNQFHDIFDGTSIHGAYEHSYKLYEQAYDIGKSSLTSSFDTLTSKIDIRGDGVPVVVFNPLAWERTDVVEIDSPFDTEETSAVVVTDGKSTFPAQLCADKLIFTAYDMPALGYKVFWLKQDTRNEKSAVSAGNNTLENEFFRIKIDPKQGTIAEIYDKNTKQHIVPKGAQANLFQILYEESTGMSAWNLGQIMKTEDLTTPSEDSEILEAGPTRALVRSEFDFRESSFVHDVMLYAGVPRIDVKLTADWREVGKKDSGTIPMVKVAFPTTVQNPKASFEIPFGSIERPLNGDEVPAQKWIDLSGEDYGVSILNNCKYGHDVRDSTMRLSLLRASYYPDPTPDQEVHEITYSIFPHAGSWKEAATPRKAYELNNPLLGVVCSPHEGSLPTSRSFLSVEPQNIIVTALKLSEDGKDLILRFYETDGTPTMAVINTSLPVKHWSETNLIERTIGKTRPAGRKISLQVGKHEIKTIRLSLQ